MQTLLKANSLTIQRGNEILVRDMGIAVGYGDLVLLVGANGSGKTSLLRAFAGLLEPLSGSVEHSGGFHFMSAQELPASQTRVEDYLKTQAALQDCPFDLSSDVFGVTTHLNTPLNRLSTGWRQRVKLSRLLLQPETLWLLDEPTDGLDAGGIAALLDLLIAHRANGGAAIIATHQPDLWPADARRINLAGVPT